MNIMKNEEFAVLKGYYIVNGEVFNKQGKPLKLTLSGRGYLKFSVIKGSRTNKNRKPLTVYVHRLVAFFKYRELLYDYNIEVRHLDGNKLNNYDDNILLGTHQENMLDVPLTDRIERSINASSYKRKFTDHEMGEIKIKKRNGSTYKELMNEYGISSKGTLHYILNTCYKTKK